MSNALIKDFGLDLEKDPELKRLYYQEKLILDVTELISKLMEKKKVNKTKLAKSLSVGKSYITQLLDGTANMTLRTISDIFIALDSELVVNAALLSLEASQSYEYEVEDETKFVADVPLPNDLVEIHWRPKEDNRMVA